MRGTDQVWGEDFGNTVSLGCISDLGILPYWVGPPHAGAFTMHPPNAPSADHGCMAERMLLGEERVIT